MEAEERTEKNRVREEKQMNVYGDLIKNGL